MRLPSRFAGALIAGRRWTFSPSDTNNVGTLVVTVKDNIVKVVSFTPST